ncbi:hypothetical protein D7D52_01255 [Nocardia yunnanensis]|uniref:Uncharacterized protein n=2 Tax=Nocardia yunnanensis TaxID=2382165 RepID=A0A386Z8C9_9NOCA|nr:hypothetical protein D7D52_01255 [Nocardia yunnanensis]
MGQPMPAVVGLYLRETGRCDREIGHWRRIAEFRLTADGQAGFRAIDPFAGLVARVWYHQGVDVLGTDRRIMPADGPAFLRALLQPFGFRDYWFRDDSSPRSGFTRTRHTPARNHTAAAAHENDRAAADVACACESGPVTGSGTGAAASRPAAWRLLDADIFRF